MLRFSICGKHIFIFLQYFQKDTIFMLQSHRMSFPCLHLVHTREHVMTLAQPIPPIHKFQYIIFGLFCVKIFQILLNFSYKANMECIIIFQLLVQNGNALFSPSKWFYAKTRHLSTFRIASAQTRTSLFGKFLEKKKKSQTRKHRIVETRPLH